MMTMTVSHNRAYDLMVLAFNRRSYPIAHQVAGLLREGLADGRFRLRQQQIMTVLAVHEAAGTLAQPYTVATAAV